MYFKSLSIIVLAAIITTIACQKSTEPENNYTGDVILYCFQDPYGNPQAQLFLINADGTNNRRIITTSLGLNHMDWSPDGTQIATTGYTNDVTNSLYKFNADGTGLTRLTNLEGAKDYVPAWSPNGSLISFTRIYNDGTNRRELWMMNSDGSNQHSIGINGSFAKWSPNGTGLIYFSDKSGNSEIYTCNADGSNEQKLTNTSSNETFPSYSHDGRKITYSVDTGTTNSWEINVMNADGTGAVRLTNNNSFDAMSWWSPDDQFIAFESERSAANHDEVYIMNADGSNVRRLTNSSGNTTAINPVWRPRR